MVFIASTIITVSPFLIFRPFSANFLPPGSGAKYAVPIIGELIFVPFISDDLFSVFSISCFEVLVTTGIEPTPFDFATLTLYQHQFWIDFWAYEIH